MNADSREPTGCEDALYYAGRKLPVFPCESIDPEHGRCTCGAADCDSPGKHPVSNLAPRGFHDATTDPELIRRWFDCRPDANVAIRTGAESGLAVLDEDQPHGGDSRADLEARFGELPDTPRVLTGGGGVQYLFEHPGSRIPCSSGKVGINLDVRGDGGYIVAPQSLHRSGRFYTFDPAATLDETPLAPMPRWLLELACGPSQQRGEQPASGGEIAKGRRNDELTRIAGALRRRGCGFDEILAALKTTNEKRCRPPLTDDEVVGIARSVMRYDPAEQPCEKDEPQSKFRFVSVPEVLSMPPVEYLVDRFLTLGGSSVLAGFTGHAKSLAAIDLALSIATGTPWHGELSVRPGLCAYVAAEGFAGFGQRVCAWLKYHNRAPDSAPAVYFLPAAPQLMAAGDVQELIVALLQLPEKPVFIVIDTMARTFLAGDEKDGKDTGLYLAGVEKIQKATGAHVCILHHTGWNMERERGHTALRAAVDTLALIAKEDNAVTISCLKQKDVEPFPDLLFEVQPWAESAVLVPTTERDRKRRPASIPATRQKVLDALKTSSEAGGLSFTNWHGTTSISKTTFHRCVVDLVSWGFVEKRGGKYVLL